MSIGERINGLSTHNVAQELECTILDSGPQLTSEWLMKDGLCRPVFVSTSRGSGLQLPPGAALGEREVVHLLGPEFEVPVLDCHSYQMYSAPLGRVSIGSGSGGTMEVVKGCDVSQSDAFSLFSAPYAVETGCLAKKLLTRGRYASFPGQFCMDIAPNRGWIDFEMDKLACQWIAAGRGTVVLYLLPPTPNHITAFQLWEDEKKRALQKEKGRRSASSSSSTSTSTHSAFFLPSYTTDPIRKVQLKRGSLLLVPPGWAIAKSFRSVSLIAVYFFSQHLPFSPPSHPLELYGA